MQARNNLRESIFTIFQCDDASSVCEMITIKVPIAPNYKDVCLQNTSKPHSYHLKIL